MKRARATKRARPSERYGHQQRSPLERIRPLLTSSWVPVVFFALLSVVYFGDMIFTGSVLYASDTGPEFHSGKEPFLEKIEKLPPPNWSRYMGGMPESSGLRSQYYPLNIISLFTSQHRYFLWRYVIAMFCAGYFTYLCVRGFGLHPLAALLAGAAYASAPAFLTFTFAGHYAKMSVIGLFPLLYWALDRGMETRRPIYFLVMGGVIGIDIYTPHLQLVYFSLWALGLVFLFKLVLLYCRDRDRIAALFRTLMAAGAVCLGLAIGAEGTFPQYWHTKTVSKRAGKQQEGAGYEFASSWALHPEEIASLAVPDFSGYIQGYWGRNAFKLNSEYVGIVALFFAVFALGRIRKDPRIAFLLALFLLVVAYTLGPHTPLHKLTYHIIPGVRVLRGPGLMAFLFSFALCALCAFGLHRLLQPEPEVTAQTLKKLTFGGGAAALVLFLASLAPESLMNLWTGVFWPGIPPEKLQVAKAYLPDIARGAMLGALFVALLTLLSRLRMQKRLGNGAFVICLLAILLMDTWRIDRRFLTVVDPDRYPPQEQVNPGVVKFLTQDKSLYRVLAIPDERQVPLKGIDFVTGFSDFALRRYDTVLKSYAYVHGPILNLLNVKYIVSQQPLSDAQATAHIDRLYIYRNPDAFPWFYLASDYVVEEDEGRVLERLKDPDFDASKTVILEVEPPLPAERSEREGEIEQLAYDPRRGYIELRTRAPASRLLLVSENYHPYWRAYVDGEEQPILRANYLWKSVPLPPGEHRVEFRYHDPIVAVCRWITVFSSIIFLGLLLVCWIRTRQQPVGS